MVLAIYCTVQFFSQELRLLNKRHVLMRAEELAGWKSTLAQLILQSPGGTLTALPRAVANPQSHEMQRSDGEVKKEHRVHLHFHISNP